MALRIRLQRHGASHAPVYRVVVTESTHRRDGRHAEVLGHYNPKARGQDVELKLNLERADYWMGVGAQPSETARSLINRARREAGAPAAEETSEA
jgi:small subunit ribosomal protein S16